MRLNDYYERNCDCRILFCRKSSIQKITYIVFCCKARHESRSAVSKALGALTQMR